MIRGKNYLTKVNMFRCCDFQRGGKKFLVGVYFNQKRGGDEFSSIRGLFPKNNAEWLNWITQGKSLYLNKNKIQNLITQQRINLADVDDLDLNSFANVKFFYERRLNLQGLQSVWCKKRTSRRASCSAENRRH